MYEALVFRKNLIRAIFYNSTSCYNSNKRILIIDYRHKILCTCALYKVIHAGGDANRNIIFFTINFHNTSGLSLTHIHVTHIF